MTRPATLDQDAVDAYTALLEPDATPEALAASRERLRGRLADGSLDGTTVFLAFDRQGALRSSVRVVPLSPVDWQLLGPLVRRRDAGAADAAAGLVRAAVARAREKGARALLTRVTEGVGSTRYLLALAEAGFLSRGGRVEFKSEVDRLPFEDDPSSLEWKSIEETGKDLAVETLRRAALGDPHGIEPSSTAEQTLSSWLSDVVLTNGPQCVHVGSRAGVPVAFLCVQVNPKSGWSRITYMGLVPEARGQGLGRAVHRHGFAMMRAQGGRTYHGGTASANEPMLALFRAAGCTLHARMSEWTLELPGLSKPG